MSQDTLLHGETLFLIPTTDSNYITLPLFTQSVCSNFWGHMLLIKSTKFVFITHFNEFLTASGWERDVQLHLGAANPDIFFLESERCGRRRKLKRYKQKKRSETFKV